MSGSTVASWSAYRFLRRQVRWSGVPISKNFSTVCCDPHCQRLWCSQWSISWCFSGTLLIYLLIQWMLAIWSLVPLPFLNPVWTSGSSWFTYCWSLTWRILSITLLACDMSAICGSLSTLWHCLSLGLEWKHLFPIMCPLPSFSNLLAYWVQYFHNIIF